MTVDPKSHQLAAVFVSDYDDDQIPMGRTAAEDRLAVEIQKAIEDWLADNLIPF